MPRPSRNLDQALLAAGRELFPARGCAGLSVREVADRAGVNLGMFHYHFKSREAFLRALMQQAYEEMFARLTLEVARPAGTVANLRSALQAIGRFVRDNRTFLARILADALTGEKCAREFMNENMPRHLGVLQGLIAQGQREGVLLPLPVPQAIGTFAGAIAMPLMVAGAMVDSHAVGAPLAQALQATVLSNEGIDQRIDLVLKAVVAPASTKPPAKRGRGKEVPS